jgi:hypothetical protein
MRPSEPDARYVPRVREVETLPRAGGLLTSPAQEVARMKDRLAAIEAKLDRILRCVDPEAE